jgi:4-pyridoxolactonase
VPETFERYAYSDQTFDHPDVSFELLEGDVELADGLRLFETPGHSAGHYSLLVEPPAGGALLFAFDAAYAHESLERLIPSGFHLDPTAAVRSLRRIQTLASTHDARIFVAHDMAAFNGYSLAPAGAV